MSKNVLKAGVAQGAEQWLLPEIQGAHLVTAADIGKSGGFKKSSQNQSAPSVGRAMTASRIEQAAQEAKEAAQASGRAEGYQQGYAEGQNKATSLVEDSQQRIDALMASITGEVEKEKEALLGLFSKLLIDLCRAVCLRELAIESRIEDIVRQALAALPLGESNITIYVSPADYDLMSGVGSRQHRWQLEISEDIASGGCRVVSDNSEIDFTLQQRVAQIADQVFDEFQASSGE